MDPFSPTGMSGLQSGFVLAVIFLAVFFADRLGGSAQVAERGFQVILGVALAYVVISGTVAFHRPPGGLEGLQGALFQDEAFQTEEDYAVLQGAGKDAAENASEVRTVHAGMGLLLAIAGLAALRRLRVLSLGLVVGGLLLLLFGGPQQPGGSGNLYDSLGTLFGAIFPGGASDAGQARDIANFAVLLAGTAALAAFGYWRWERRGIGLAAAA